MESLNKDDFLYKFKKNRTKKPRAKSLNKGNLIKNIRKQLKGKPSNKKTKSLDTERFIKKIKKQIKDNNSGKQKISRKSNSLNSIQKNSKMYKTIDKCLNSGTQKTSLFSKTKTKKNSRKFEKKCENIKNLKKYAENLLENAFTFTTYEKLLYYASYIFKEGTEGTEEAKKAAEAANTLRRR